MAPRKKDGSRRNSIGTASAFLLLLLSSLERLPCVGATAKKAVVTVHAPWSAGPLLHEAAEFLVC